MIVKDQRNKSNPGNVIEPVAPTRVEIAPSLLNLNVVQPGIYIPPDAGFYMTFENSTPLPVTLAVKVRYYDIHPSQFGEVILAQKVKETTFNVALTDASRNKVSLLVGVLNDVYVLDVNINTLSGAVIRGSTFVTLYFSRSALGTAFSPIVGVLSSGYLSNDKPLTLGEKNLAVDGKGRMRYLNVANPAPATNFTYTVETNTRVRIHSLRFLFITSATVATRTARLIIRDPSGINLAVHEHNATQVASLSNNYLWGINLQHYTALSSGDFEAPLIDTELLQGSVVTSSINNLSAGDQISNIEIDIEEWYDTTGTSGIGGTTPPGEKGQS